MHNAHPALSYTNNTHIVIVLLFVLKRNPQSYATCRYRCIHATRMLIHQYTYLYTLWSPPHLMDPVEGKVQAVSLVHYSLVPWHIGHIRIPLQVNLVHIYAIDIALVVQPLLANVSGMGRLH